MADIQIVISKELGKAAMASKSHAGKLWIVDAFERQALPTGNDVIVYLEEAQVNGVVKEIHLAGLQVHVLG